nr:esterase [Spirosomataceae bacterium]
MRKTLFFLFMFWEATTRVLAQTEPYPTDSASVERAGVPKGQLLKLTLDNSKIFPGTWREI